LQPLTLFFNIYAHRLCAGGPIIIIIKKIIIIITCMHGSALFNAVLEAMSKTANIIKGDII